MHICGFPNYTSQRTPNSVNRTEVPSPLDRLYLGSSSKLETYLKRQSQVKVCGFCHATETQHVSLTQLKTMW
uniref:Uncharacterized protein n=1 Tax=Anguilla anguilla TaxID=7936 RepID=A0A0E9R834_ANGAN